MALEQAQIIDEYSKNKDVYTNLSREAAKILEDEISKSEINLAFPVAKRVKELKSIIKKIENGAFTPKSSISELWDIIGLRVILLYKKDLDEIDQIIKTNFPDYKREDIKYRNKISFGYSSIHYVCSTPKAWSEVKHLQVYKNLKFEIQVRTLSEHIWAASSHSLNYKSEVNIPQEIERPLIRLAAILEIVDDELIRIYSTHTEYIKTIQKADIDSVTDLNTITLEVLLTNLYPVAEKLNSDGYAYLNKVIEEDNNIRNLLYLRDIIKHYDNGIQTTVLSKQQYSHHDIITYVLNQYKEDNYWQSKEEEK